MVTGKAKKFDFIFPGALSLAFFVSVVVWLKIDTSLPHYDMGHHLVNSLEQLNLWQGFLSGQKNIAGLLTSYLYYPPLVHQIGIFFNQLFGYSPDVSVYSNLVWILILSYSLYNLILKYLGRSAASAALFFIYASPMMIGMTREFQLDFPLTAVTMLAVWTLDRSNYFSSRKWSVIFGLICGAGMMVKWNFAIFIAPLVFFYIIYGFRSKNIQVSKLLANTVLAIAAMLLVCGAWYGRNIIAIWADFQQNGLRQAVIEGDPHGFNLAAFGYYFHVLGAYYLSIPMLFITIIGLIYFLINRKYLVLPLLLIFYYVLISVLPNKDARYIMPVILILSLIAGAPFPMIGNGILKNSLLALVAIIFVFNNASVAFGKYWLPAYRHYLWTDRVEASWLPQSGYTSSSPQNAACPIEKIIDLVPVGASAKEVGQSRIDLSDWAMAYYLTINSRKWVKQEEPLTAADYLIWRSINDSDLRFEQLKNSSELTQIGEVDCRDDSEVSVWRVKK